jgi:outer membrane protein TolC
MARLGRILLAGVTAHAACGSAQDRSNLPPAVVYLSLKDGVQKALRENRDLQIERLNPPIFAKTLSASYGVYDPQFALDYRYSDTSDSGGFDAADLSKDAVYQAKADTLVQGLTGLLPFGMSYQLGGTYGYSYGVRNDLNFESYNLRGALTVQQPLLKNFWTDQNRLTIRINKSNLRITELGVQYVAMDTVNRVAQAYFELVGVREQLQVLERLRAMKEQTWRAVQRKIELGALTVLDDKLAQAQVTKVDTLLVSARNAVTLAESALRSLLGEYSVSNAVISLVPLDGFWAEPQTFDLEASCQQGLAHRPDLLQLKQDVDKASATVRFRRNQLLPSLDMVAGYGRRGASTVQVTPP